MEEQTINVAENTIANPTKIMAVGIDGMIGVSALNDIQEVIAERLSNRINKYNTL